MNEIKIEILMNTLRKLTDKYADITREYVEECAIDFMSRRATYLDGQLAILHTLIEEVEDELAEARGETAPDFDEEDFDLEEDDVNEVGYDPYSGCYDADL